MFSEELRELDRNTVQLMIDEMLKSDKNVKGCLIGLQSLKVSSVFVRV